MINLLKSFYISLYISCLSITGIYALFQLFLHSITSVWLGIAIATISALSFFIRLFAAPVARTSSGLHGFLVVSIIGAITAMILATDSSERNIALIYGFGLGVIAQIIYIYWYSRLNRKISDVLAEGQPLPEFTLHNSDGSEWQSSVLTSPALFLFFRGNWCPLCMAQIKEVAEEYKKLESMGVEVFLVSPQPEKQTRILADKFSVNYQFMVDSGNQVAKQLGIAAEHGTPKGLELLGYQSDTVLPTVIMTNSDGKIIFSDQTDNYRVRPEPDTFIRIFQEKSA